MQFGHVFLDNQQQSTKLNLRILSDTLNSLMEKQDVIQTVKRTVRITFWLQKPFIFGKSSEIRQLHSECLLNLANHFLHVCYIKGKIITSNSLCKGKNLGNSDRSFFLMIA